MLKLKASESTEKSQLKWACRRGMLELDVLLGNFLEEAYQLLNHQEQKDFKELLALPDPVLFKLLVVREQSLEEPFLLLADKIIAHARSRL